MALKVNEVSQIYLGIQGENGSREITIDVSDWLVAHPQGSVSIWHKRNGDATPSATGAVFDDEAGTVTWSPSNVDTYVSGEGEAEIRLTENTVIKKSRTIRTGVSPAVTGGGQTLGSDWQSYIDEVDRLKSLAVAAKQDAEQAAEDAEAYAAGTRGGTDVESDDPAYHNNAKYYKELANTAAGEAEAAQAAAETAQGKAEDAQTAAEAAQGLAEDARDAAIVAQAKAETAQGKAEDAQTAAETAQGKAEDAQEAAETAQGKAEDAQTAAETAQGKAEDAQEAAETAQGKAEEAQEAAEAAAEAAESMIDDTAGAGDTDKVWSADKLTDEFSDKADKEDTVLTTTLSRGRKSGTTAGTGSFAFGNDATASGNYSHAEGNRTTASGNYSHAEGNQTTASNLISHAEGAQTTAEGAASHAEGTLSNASAENAHAEGYNTRASGENSHAEGDSAEATGDSSHAEGMHTEASGDYSHAEGRSTKATNKYQHVFGKYNAEDPLSEDSTSEGNFIEIVGNGTNSARSNARSLDWNGNERLKGDLYVQCDADSQNGKKVATEEKVEALIDDTAGDGDTDKTWSADKITDQLALKAPKEDPEFTTRISLGRKADTTKGSYQGLIGYDVEAEGNYLIASGQSTIANGDHCDVSGIYNVGDPVPQNWVSGKHYYPGDMVMKPGSGMILPTPRICITENDDTTFDDTKWKYYGMGARRLLEIVGNGTGETPFRSNARATDRLGNGFYMGNLFVNCSAHSKGGDRVATYGFPLTNDTEAAVMQIQDGGDDVPAKVKSAIEPVQDMHGYNNPWPGGGGKNLFDAENTSNTWVSPQNAIVENSAARSNKINVSSGTTLTISGNFTATTSGGSKLYLIAFVDSSDNVLSRNLATSGTSLTATAPNDTSYALVGVYTVDPTTSDVQVEVGSAATTYEPYSNICPITGWTGAKITRTGKNLIPNGTNENNGYVADKYLKNDNTTGSQNGYYISEYFKVLPDTAYIYGVGSQESSTNHNAPSVCFYDNNKNFISGTAMGKNVSNQITTPSNAAYARATQNIGDSSSGQKIIFNLGSTAIPHEDYNGTTYDITFPTSAGTVYGGTLTVNKDGSGKLIVDRACDDFKDMAWEYNSTYTLFQCLVSGKPGTTGVDSGIISTIYKSKPYGGNTSYEDDNIIFLHSNGSMRLRDTRYTDAATLKTALTGQKVVYPISYTSEYDFNAQQIRTLLGTNNLWADTGNMLQADYIADTKTYIDQKIAALAAQIGS